MALRNNAGAVLTRAQVLALTTPVTADPEVTVNQDVYEDTETEAGGATGGQRLRWHAGDVVLQSEIDAEYPLPTISATAPAGGALAGGTALTVTGTGFVRGYESIGGGATEFEGHGVTVSVGGVACTNVVVVSDTEITCVTGAHAAGATDVVVTTAAGTATHAGAFTYA